MNAAVSAHYLGVDQRKSPRSDVYARVVTSFADGRSPMTTMVNISADGALLRHSEPVKEGDPVSITLPVLGRVAGTIVWAIGGRIGVHFDEAICAADYAPLLRAIASST